MYNMPGFWQISVGQIAAQVGGFLLCSLLFCGSAYALEKGSAGLKTTWFTSDSVPSFICNISKSILSDSSFYSETSKISSVICYKFPLLVNNNRSDVFIFVKLLATSSTQLPKTIKRGNWRICFRYHREKNLTTNEHSPHNRQQPNKKCL